MKKRGPKTKLILIILLVFLILIIATVIYNFFPKSQKQELKTMCNNYGGIWIEDHNECERISSQNCQNMGGTYKECESSCRHSETSDFCTLECIEVCVFN